MHPVPARATMRSRRMRPSRGRTIRQQTYTQTMTVPLLRAAQAVVSASTAQIAVGPAGVGTKWYPQTVTFTTTSGYADGSTVQIYGGYVSQYTLLDSNVYPGGASSAGLAIPLMVPGDLLVFYWTNAHNGDIAQVTLTGTQDTLVTG